MKKKLVREKGNAHMGTSWRHYPWDEATQLSLHFDSVDVEYLEKGNTMFVGDVAYY